MRLTKRMVEKRGELSINQKAVLDYLRKQEAWVSPTEIGSAVGGYNRSSAWASPICKGLVFLGLVERSEKGWYRSQARRSQNENTNVV